MNTLTIFFSFLLVSFGYASSTADAPTSGRPSVDDVPRFGRWLVGQGSWGYLTTIRVRDSVPFGYPVSYADAATGVPFFYLSKLDPAGSNAEVNPQACFSLSEQAIDGCPGADTQSPRCAKISLVGQLMKLPEGTWEEKAAEAALFAQHPQFAGFPKANGSFAVFKLEIEEIFLVNKAAGRRELTVEDYLAAGDGEE